MAAISVSFSCGKNVTLEVCNAGAAIAAKTARELLRRPVSSDSGLGIGLYQVARHAEVSGFTLALAHNADGKVSFVLSGALKPAAEPPAAACASPSACARATADWLRGALLKVSYNIQLSR